MLPVFICAQLANAAEDVKFVDSPNYNELVTINGLGCETEADGTARKTEVQQFMEDEGNSQAARLKDIFDAIKANTAVFELTNLPPLDVVQLLERMKTSLRTPMGNAEAVEQASIITFLQSEITSHEDVALLKRIMMNQPLFALMIKKEVVDSKVFKELLTSEMAMLCMAALTPVKVTYGQYMMFIRRHPYCVSYHRMRAKASETDLTIDPKIQIKSKGKVILRYLREIGQKLLVQDLYIAPYAVKTEDISSFTDAEVATNSDKFIAILYQLRTEVRQVLATRVISKDPPNGWTQVKLNKLCDLLNFAPADLLVSFSSNQGFINKLIASDCPIHENLVAFLGMDLPQKKEEDSFNKRFCLLLNRQPEIVLDYLDSFTSAELLAAMKTCKTELATILESETADFAISETTEPFSSNDINAGFRNGKALRKKKKEAASVLPQILSKVFADKESTPDIADLGALKEFLPYAPNHVFENVDQTAMVQALPGILQVKGYTLRKLRVIYKKLKEKLPAANQLSKETLIKMGPLVLALSCDDLKAIPGAALVELAKTDFFKQELPCQDNEEACVLLASKATKTALTEEEANAVVGGLSDLAMFVKNDDINANFNVESDKLNSRVRKKMTKKSREKIEEDAQQEISSDDEQSKERVLKNKFKENLLASKKTDKKTQETPQQGENNNIMRRKKVPEKEEANEKLLDLEGEELSNMDASSSTLEVLTEVVQARRIKRNEEEESDVKNSFAASYKVLQKYFRLDKEDVSDVCVEGYNAENLAPVFTAASSTDMKKLSKESRKKILKYASMEPDTLKDLSRETIKEIFQQLLADDATDLGESWTVEDLRKRGTGLWCGMTMENVDKLSNEAAAYFSPQLCSCPQLSSGVRQKIFDKIKNHYNGLNGLASFVHRIKRIKSCVIYVDPEEVAEIDVENKRNFRLVASMTIMNMQERLDQLEMDGIEGQADLAKERQLANNFASRLWKWFITNGMGVADVIRIFNGKFIKQDAIEGLSNDDLKSVLSVLKHADFLSKTEKAKIKSKVIEIYGDVSTWSEDFLQSLGNLAGIFLKDSETLGKLTLSDCAVKNLLKELPDEMGVLETVCERVTADNFQEMLEDNPRIMCCKIAQTQATSDDVLEMTMCPPCLKSKKATVNRLAKKVTTKHKTEKKKIDAKTIEDMKCVAGGLQEEDVAELTTEAFQQMDSDAMELMDADVVCKAMNEDSDKLKTMSRETRKKIKSDAMSCLKGDVFKKLLEEDAPERKQTKTVRKKDDLTIKKIKESTEFQTIRNKVKVEPSEVENGQTKQCLTTKGAKKDKDLTAEDLTALKEEEDADGKHIIDYIRETVNLAKLKKVAKADLMNAIEALKTNFGTRPEREEAISIVKNMKSILDGDDEGEKDKLLNILSTLPPFVLTLFEEELMCAALEELTGKYLMGLAKRLAMDDVSIHTFRVINSCPVVIHYLRNSYDNEELINLFTDDKGASYLATLASLEDKLSIFDLSFAPGQVNKEILKSLDMESFDNDLQLRVLGKIFDDFPKVSKGAIAKSLIRRKPDILQEASFILSLIEPVLLEMNKEFLESFDKIQLMNIVKRNVEHVKKMTPEKRKLIAGLILKYVQENSQNIPEDLFYSPNIYCLFDGTQGLVRQDIYDEDFLTEMQIVCAETYMFSSEGEAARKKTNQAVRNLEDNSEKSLEKIGVKNLKHLNRKKLKTFTKEALKSKLSELPVNEFKNSQKRVIWEKIKEDFSASTLSCGQLAQISPYLEFIDKEYFTNIPQDKIKECFNMLSEKINVDYTSKRNRRLMKRIRSKIKATLGEGQTLKNFIQENDFPQKMATIMDKETAREIDIETDSDIDRAINIVANGFNHITQVLVLRIDFNKVKNQQKLFKNPRALRVYLLYATREQVDLLEDSDAKNKAIFYLCKNVDETEGFSRLKEFCRREVEKRLGVDDECEDNSICLDDGEATGLGPVIMHSTKLLRCLTKKTRRIVFDVVADNEYIAKTLTRNEMKNSFQLAKQAQDDESNEGEENDKDESLGLLNCGRSNSDVESMSDSEVNTIASKFAKCMQLEMNTKKTVAKKTVDANGGIQKYRQERDDNPLGSIVVHTDAAKNIRNQGQTDELQDLLTNTFGGDYGCSAKQEYARKAVKRNEIEESEKNDITKECNTFSKEAFESTVTNSRRRRKRALNDDEMCSLLESFDGNLCDLTMEDIEAIGDDVIEECSSQFQDCEFSTEIFGLLASKAVKGKPSNVAEWETSDYEDLGILIGYLEQEVIDTLILNEEVLEAIPKDRIYPNSDKLVARHLTVAGTTLSELTAEFIGENINILGQLPIEELNKLQPERVGEAATDYDLAEDINIPEESLEHIANKIVEAAVFEAETASLEEISNLGAILGKFPKETLKELNSEQLSALDSEAVALIEPEDFSEIFTLEDIEFMTAEQANAVTDSQKSNLPEDLKQAITGKGTVTVTVVVDDKNDGGSENSAGFPHLSFLLLTVAPLFALWKKFLF